MKEEKNPLRTKRDYKRFAKSEGKVMFYIETDAHHLSELSWSILGVCTLEAQRELRTFLGDWEKRHNPKSE